MDAVDPDRRTWSKLIRCHRTLLKELRDEFEWRRAEPGLVARIEEQRRKAEFAREQGKALHGNAAVSRGAGSSGNPFADSCISLEQVPPLNRASPKIPPLSPPPSSPLPLYNETPTPIAAGPLARKDKKKKEPSPRSTTGAGAAAGLSTLMLSPPPLMTTSATAMPIEHDRPARFNLASPRGYAPLSTSNNHAALEGNGSTLGMLPAKTTAALPVNPRSARAPPLSMSTSYGASISTMDRASRSELEPGEPAESEGWCCDHLHLACKEHVRTMKRKT